MYDNDGKLACLPSLGWPSSGARSKFAMVVILVGLGFLRDSYLEYFMVKFASEASKASLIL